MTSRTAHSSPAGGPIIIVGPPGAGKTTIGQELAAILNVEFRDTDADIVDHVGKPISDIFVDDGEEHFRALEKDAVAKAVSEHEGVIALGGGAVMAEDTRSLLSDAFVLFLDVNLATAVKRVELDRGRPLLAVNPRATMRALLEQRRPLYRDVASMEIDTSDREVSDVVNNVAMRVTSRRVDVGGEHPYSVIIGAGVTSRISEFLGSAQRVAIVYTASVAYHAGQIAQAVSPHAEPTMLEVPDAEDSKTVTIAEQCWEALGAEGFTRTDLIIGVGGGAVTDLAGFVAASWLRGVAVVHVPTSLLGMVDAAVGGKTGVNTAAGKNLVGAFHPPRAVLCDTTSLTSLPSSDVAAGMAEIVKAGFIADPVILDLIETDPAVALNPSSETLVELIERSIAVKADVVASDLRESGRRAILNYGHTFAHAVEKYENYQFRHGDAVAIGMVYAAHLSALTGRADVVDRTVALLRTLGLPTSYPAGRWEALFQAMRIDKKALGSTVRFVLLDDVAQPVIASDVTAEAQQAAYEKVSA